MTLLELDVPTRELIALSAAIAVGEEPAVRAGCLGCLAAEVPAVWVDELLLQSTLMVGWPRALSAAALWRELGTPAQPGEDGADYSAASRWQARGESLCRVIYGAQYERLRANVRALHPALEAWMVTEGYGRTLGREGLDLARRELCIVAQVAVQGAERQLHSHLKGAVHAGVSPDALDATVVLLRPILGRRECGLLESLWDRIRSS